jgi:hypothetical protein
MTTTFFLGSFDETVKQIGGRQLEAALARVTLSPLAL